MRQIARPSARGRISRRRFLEGLGIIGAGFVAAVACGGEEKRRVLTTLDRTVALGDDGALSLGPGEGYVVRTDLAQAQAGREAARRSLATFHHLSDFRIVDEESPLRSEWVEACAEPLSTGAFRPQETLSAQAAASLVARANDVNRSPVTGRSVDFALHTGNAADNAQYNELRWFVDLMDGALVAPSSGNPEYQGVQEESPAGGFPDLIEEAQHAFQSPGLRYPWYTALGNRDVLAQGNFPPTDGAKAIALGEAKIIAIGPDAAAEVCADPSKLLSPGESSAILDDPEAETRRVAPDGDRRLLSRREWVEEHFATAASPGPPGHGLTAANRDAGTAYYAFDSGDLTMVVLDTVNPGGFSAGSIDATQFAWLEEQLAARSSAYLDAQGRQVTTESADRLIVVASHHALDLLNNPFPGPEGDEERVRGPQLEALLHRFPNVVLHVSGHSGEQRIAARPDPAGRTGAGVYWEVSTGSPVEFPMQGRLLDVVDNGDGTLSVFSTMYNIAAPLDPGDAKDGTPDDGVNETLLASVARLVAAGDPQRDVDASGLGVSDRNAELLLPAPFDLAAAPRTPAPPAVSPAPTP